MISKTVRKSALKALQILFYLAFILLWFKDNFPPFKSIPLSPLWGFLALAAVLLISLAPWLRARKFSLPPDWKRDAVAIGLLVLVALLIHLPFLFHSFGLMDGDEAITALMSKHIAEGKRPPLYFYGAFFQGSLPQHFTAVFIRLFGYSIFLAKLSAFLAFAIFLGAQFILLKKAISFEFACAAGLFYLFPWQHLVQASFDLASGFPAVLLLGSLIFFLTMGIVFEDKRRWGAALGFILGLAFWTHQISIIYGVSIAPFLIYKFRTRLKDYLTLVVYFLVGCFPLLLNEFVRGFPIVRVFFLGQSGSVDAKKLIRARRLFLALFSSGRSPGSLMYLGVIAFGLLTIILFVAKRKAPPASLILIAYLVSFTGIYLLSQSSSADIIRYFYILYIAVPVFLCAPFLWLKPKIRFVAAAVFLGFVFVVSQARSSLAFYNDIKSNHAAYSRALTTMTETGEKYWISDFWTSYLLTSISKENLIVASFGVRRYYPYELWYWSQGRNNWVFSMDNPDMKLYASVLPDVLDKLGVGYETKKAGGLTLVYRIQQDVFPRIIFADPPGALPDIRPADVTSEAGRLKVTFVQAGPPPAPGLGLQLEIPGFSSRFFPMPQEERFSYEIPFPGDRNVKIRYCLTYAGFRLERSAREADFTLSSEEAAGPRPPVEYLTGIGPDREVEGRAMLACRKEASFEVNRPVNRGLRLTLHLYSPFDFQSPWWYGDFSQTVTIFINGRRFGEKVLKDGKNRILIKLEPPVFEGHRDIVRLEFKYAMPTFLDDNWKSAAYLERIAFE
jgi:hypothetical protein